MKIRTDFVTNSSSYSSAEIMIDNPVLLEILARYQDMGLFPEGPYFSIGYGEFKLRAHPDVEPEVPEERRGFSITPAFYFGDDDDDFGAYPPESLEELITRILEFMEDLQNDSAMDEELFDQMKLEIEQRRDEINQSFAKVYWERGLLTNEHDYEEFEGWVDETATFLYDRVKGARCTCVAKDSDTGEIVHEE